jgi:NAD(P)-dependent dehydrogenase (short-subunit alcohol dehydrogenase family)
MNGKTIITGATGGIGAAVTRALAARGCELVLACRSMAKAEALRQQILAGQPQARLEVRPLDLCSLASVRAFAEGFGSGEVSALFNNAGAISRGYALTGDGLENTFSINYFAPFLLTQCLLPALEPDARVVNMVSLTCRFVRVDEAALCPAEKDFSQLGTYARAKLALLLSSLELAGRYPQLRVNLADPGVVNSGIISMGRWFDPLADVLFRPFIKSPEKGAIPPLAALASDGRNRYFVGNRSVDIPARYRDPGLQRRLWDETERLLAIR